MELDNWVAYTGIASNLTVFLGTLFGLTFYRKKIKYEKSIDSVEKIITELVEIEYNFQLRMKYWKKYYPELGGINTLLGKQQLEKNIDDDYPFEIKFKHLIEKTNIYLNKNFSHEIEQINEEINQIITDTFPLRMTRDVSLAGEIKNLNSDPKSQGFKDKCTEIRILLPKREKELLEKIEKLKIKIKNSIK